MRNTIQQLIDMNLIQLDGEVEPSIDKYVWASSSSIITFSVDGITHIVDTIECSEHNMIAIMCDVNGAWADMAEGYKFFDFNNQMSLPDLADRSHMYDNDHKSRVLAATVLYCQHSDGEDVETMRVSFVDNEAMQLHVTGEESGEEYAIEFDDIDLRNDLFYTTVRLDTSKF
jgi:hypothetical protein